MNPNIELEIKPLFDPVGLAGTVPDLESLLITTETIPGGKMVNETRLKNKLAIVDLPILGFGNMKIENKISSTDIRKYIVQKNGSADFELLKKYWKNSCDYFKINVEKQLKWWDILVEYYSMDFRYYHTLNHIEKMLMQTTENQKLISKNIKLFEFACWFHDVIYYPSEKDNEEKSIKLFEEFSHEILLSKSDIKYVCKLIEVTKTHKIEDSENDAKLFIDLDLSILGSTPEEYHKYSEMIKLEYSYLPLENYIKGRISVLQKFLERTHIFLTCEFQEKYEAKARENIATELKKLQNCDI